MKKNTFKLTVHDTNEFGMIMHFLSTDDVYEYFSLFQEIYVEKKVDYPSPGLKKTIIIPYAGLSKNNPRIKIVENTTDKTEIYNLET